jgi:hypothetical protein
VAAELPIRFRVVFIWVRLLSDDLPVEVVVAGNSTIQALR